MLILVAGLCCVGFVNFTGVVAGVRKQGPVLSVGLKIQSQKLCA
jgi:hypothetical protein